MSWIASLLPRLGHRRAILQSDGEPSIEAFGTATLLAAPFVELVESESPVGEHASIGVAESAMREVKRQTRTLNCVVEAHLGKIVESRSILKWIPTMASDSAVSSGLVEMAWKRKCHVLCVLGRNSLQSSENLSTSAQRQQPQLQVGCNQIFRTGSILIMTTDGVVKAAGFRRMNVENRWNVDSWRSSLGCYRKRSRRCRGHSSSTSLSYTIFFWLHVGATSREKVWSDIAVHGKKATPHTDETRMEQQMARAPEDHERLQVHERRRDAELEVEEAWAPGDPALWNSKMLRCRWRYLESASVQRGADMLWLTTKKT